MSGTPDGSTAAATMMKEAAALGAINEQRRLNYANEHVGIWAAAALEVGGGSDNNLPIMTPERRRQRRSPDKCKA